MAITEPLAQQTGNTTARHQVLLLLGSNVRKEHFIPEALRRLREHPAWRVTHISRIYATPPAGRPDQPPFWNVAVALETDLPIQELHAILRQIEAELGRVRSADKYAPRTIDIDIALYDDFVGQVNGSQVPEPNITRYAHAAVPLAEIAPERVHPVDGRTLAQIAAAMDRSQVRPVHSRDARAVLE